MKKCILLISVFLFILSCVNNENGSVVGFHNEVAYNEFKRLLLDETHKNLLNPNISDKEEYPTIINSWKNLHGKVNAILKDSRFSWNVPDSTITVVNKIYFNANGEVNYFFVNIRNENISNETKDLYVQLLTDNLKELSINLQREEPFAQCGKVNYQNYE